MQLDVRKLIHAPGERMEFRFSLDLSDVDFGGRCPVQRPVVVTGQVRNTAGMLELTFEAFTVLDAVCDRCMKEFDLPKTVSAQFLLAEEVQDEENDEIILLENGTFDLGDLARTVFLLDLDTKILCSPECKGLCPRCGADLNQGPCGCKKDADPRWAALAKLLEQKDD